MRAACLHQIDFEIRESFIRNRHPMDAGKLPASTKHKEHPMSRFALLAFITIACAPSLTTAEDAKPDQAALDKKFAESMTGVRMKGRFTITGKEGELKEDSYEITKVTKLDIDDLWAFEVHMKYGDVDKTFRAAVPVKWAGSTPVISLDKTTIPGMGSFSARIVIDGNQYAGTWSHDGKGGGHMFGSIEKIKE
jgi:hypothetical protein